MSERIWIMGASDGIGAAVARLYAERGARLILSARRLDALEELASSIGGAEVIAADVSDPDSLRTAAAQIASGGLLDRAINFAALYDPGKTLKADLDKAKQIITVNMFGTLCFAQTAQPLLKQGGQLVLTGSVAGFIGLPQGQIYSATKAGVISLAETLRAELAGQTDVRLISPGFVDTRMTQQNDFDMPAMVTTDTASAAIVAGLDRGGFEVHFPKRLTLALKFLRLLPYWALLPITKRLVR